MVRDVGRSSRRDAVCDRSRDGTGEPAGVRTLRGCRCGCETHRAFARRSQRRSLCQRQALGLAAAGAMVRQRVDRDAVHSPERRRQATLKVDGSGQFAVQPTFASTYGPGGSAAARAGSVSMDFDVRAIDESQRAARFADQTTQDLRPQPHCDPSTPSRVDRGPRPIDLGKVPPRRSGTYDPTDRRNHQLVIFARPTVQVPASTAPEYRTGYINIFSRFHSGPFNHRRLEQNIFRYGRLRQLKVS